MNVVGKILVILNLLFSLVVGGFLVIDVATRQNWKARVEAQELELKAIYASRETSQETAGMRQQETKVWRSKLEALQKERKDDNDEWGLKLIQKDRELEQIRNQIRDSEAKSQLASVEVKRYAEENTNLKGFIGDRDREIVKLNFAIRDLTKDKEDLKNFADSMQLRASSLMEDLRQARQR